MTRNEYRAKNQENNSEHIAIVNDLLNIHRSMRDRYSSENYVLGETILLRRLYLLDVMGNIDPTENTTLYTTMFQELRTSLRRYEMIEKL